MVQPGSIGESRINNLHILIRNIRKQQLEFPKCAQKRIYMRGGRWLKSMNLEN